MNDTVFPTTKEALSVYFSVAVPYVGTNSARFGISDERKDALIAYYGTPSTADTYLYFLAKWADSSTRTRIVITKLEDSEEKMKKMLTEIYNDIPATTWTADDRDILNRKTGLPKTHTIPITPIAEKCIAGLTAKGSGVIGVKCRSNEDDKRASKPEGADAVEAAYRNDPPLITEDENGNKIVSKDKVQLKSPDDGTTKVIVTKASFDLQFPIEDAGNNIQFYFRFINTKHPNLNGLWSGPYSISLS
jgi:hypothetical protein